MHVAHRTSAFLGLGGWVLVQACSSAAVAPATHPVGAGDVARVGEVGVPAILVAEVARAQGVTVRTALGHVVEDALLSEGARARHLTDDPAVRFACDAAQA